MTFDLQDGLDTRNARIKIIDASPSAVLGDATLDTPQPGAEGGASWSKMLIYGRDNASDTRQWQEAGFTHEATIEGFYEDDSDAIIWALFTDPGRSAETLRDAHELALRLARSKDPLPEEQLETLPPGFTMRCASPEDAERISALMNAVFPAYPSELSTRRLRMLMERSLSIFRLIENEDGKLVAVASAEIDHDRKNAELTDCTTHPDYRGKGLSKAILHALHGDLVRDWDIHHVYSIARALETGMNCVFRQLGYHYTGRLVANSHMPEGWESMNIWCRTL